MPAFFQIVVDQSARLVRVKVFGFFETTDIERFTAERDKACALVRALGGMHVTIVDMRGTEIQSQDTVALFRGLEERSLTKSGRLAVVVGKSLIRSQVRRVIDGRNYAIFATIEDAEEWLWSENAAAA